MAPVTPSMHIHATCTALGSRGESREGNAGQQETSPWASGRPQGSPQTPAPCVQTLDGTTVAACTSVPTSICMVVTNAIQNVCVAAACDVLASLSRYQEASGLARRYRSKWASLIC